MAEAGDEILLTIETKYKSYTHNSECVYDGKLGEIYHTSKYGYYIKDHHTDEHLGIAQHGEIQYVVNAGYKGAIIEALPGPVDLNRNPIGTLYVHDNTAYVSVEYLGDIVECIKPSFGNCKKFRADQLSYGVYKK